MDATTSGLAADARSLDRLKLEASRDPQAAMRKVSAQFEAMFMQSLLKSMREAMPKFGLMDGSSTPMYTEMLDQQLAQKMAGRPGGLADVIARQLSRNMGVPADQVRAGGATADGGTADGAPGLAMRAGAASGQPLPLPAREAGGSNQVAAAMAAKAAADAGRASPQQSDFVQRMWRHAVAAQGDTGVPAHYVIGQAALESGWGRREIRHADGSSSHNLFGIKAGKDWQGRTVETATTEYVGGRPRRVVQRFRAYDSYADAFRDWARLVGGNERYGGVIRASASGSVNRYAQGMQRAGYATDPQYGDKLEQTINKTLAIRRLVI
ncbi:MAG: flagellar assembly peptidoglycan hydrolase FlgJ [Burkholderiaceae bacterium]